MQIRTEYRTNATGKGQILAKCRGSQRTVSYDHDHTPEWNHGNAAGVLALALGLAWSDEATHENLDGEHRFSL